KIGGKAAGMMLAYKILREPDPQDPFPITPYITIPDSYFIGADVFYAFVAHNELYPYFDQKYKEREQIEADYPETYERFTQGRFPEGVINELTGLMERLGPGPLIVRSSSLLEDNFGKSFAGKYTSFFCPNQGTPAENLDAVLDAIRRVYASILNPDALCYRRQVGLLDYDERMAILIQRVVGASHGRYFFPTVGGVAFGRNPFRWNRQIRREDGFMRIVWGLGTRAVDRVSNDYPRMVALSHPHLRPEITAAEIRKYSQHFIDVLDLEDNVRRTLPVAEIITSGFPGIEMLASLDEGDYIKPLVYRDTSVPPEQLVLTFNRLFQDKTFIALMQAMLRKLERAYGWPVDIEFAIDIAPRSSKLPFRIHLLQCRPLSSPKDESPGHQIPAYVPAQDVLFTSGHLVPEGIVSSIEYVVYVDPLRYAHISDHVVQSEIGRIIGRLNKKLAGRRYILMGPGRWGSANIDLGVPVSYADIYNTAMLVEIAFAGAYGTPEVSYGTHFFQDLVETNIYPLSLYPDRADTVFNQSFFDQAPNALSDLLPQDAANAQFVKVIDVRAVSGGRLLQVIMSAEEERAIAYLQDAP
ncbi:MAG: PEP/pyruvate-binding domain-containing protein, partial [Chloroflexi bacterium]|nr:PEP/pyruvate-binding domain-containing protein [Chloroflexota bacterium]